MRRAAIAGLCLASLAWPAEFYVSPAGRDTNPGTLNRPFASIVQARNAVRKLVAAGLRENVTVYLRGGTYTLTETVVFGLQDSGSAQHSITYAAYRDEEPRIGSGVRITGWRKAEGAFTDAAAGKVWVADLPRQLSRFYSLFDANGHLPRARTAGFSPRPQPGTQHQKALPFEDHLESSQGDLSQRVTTLYFPPGAVKSWPNLDDVELIIRPSFRWTMNILPLASVDEATGIARTTLPGTYPLGPIENEAAKTAWIENVPEALSEPGQWVLNTHTRKLYLWPRGDAPGGDVAAPALRELFLVEGRIDAAGPADTPVRNLHFRGLTFLHADRDEWKKDDIGIQHDWFMLDKGDALIRFRGVESSSIERCRFLDSGGNAIRLDLHAQRNRIEGNEIRNQGQGGILLIGYGPGVKDVNHHNQILNNHIHHSGLLYWHSHAVVLWQSGDNRVANNYIHHMPRKGISLSGVRLPYFQNACDSREICRSLRRAEIGPVKSFDDTVRFLHTRNNLVEQNEVAHVLQKMGDGSAINVTGTGGGNVIRRNYIHDIFTLEFVGGCLRTDGWVTGTVWEENVIFRANIAAWEHKGSQNVINNYAVALSPSRYFRLYYDSVDGSVIERNIFFHPKGPATFYSQKDPRQLAGSTVNRNLYYAEGAPPAVLDQLHAQGVGKDDLFADPGFVDWEHGDFRLKPGSPALRLGIRQIDVRAAGLTKAFDSRLMR